MNSVKEFCVLFTILCLSCEATRNELFEHKSRVARYKCGEPQPRVVALEDIFIAEDLSSVRVLPHVTVLHRCENSGCCDRINETCQPDETDDVELVFRFSHFHRHKLRTVTVSNHTSCSCQLDENTPK